MTDSREGTEGREFDVVSIDLFQTLVSIDSRRHHIWRAVLGERYSENLAEEYWTLTSDVVMEHFHRLTSQRKFLPLKSIFEEAFVELFRVIKLDFDPREAAHIFVTQHALAAWYEETRTFLDSVAGKYPLCLITDADADMLSPSLLNLCHFDSVFISAEFSSYKNDVESKFFSAVVEHYGIPPERILHIGDGSSDVLGARRVGMTTCWVNRNGRSWQYHRIRPDYTVRALLEVSSILGVDSSG
jgi:FMN phosphatase YigB (HAD superfamily)